MSVGMNRANDPIVDVPSGVPHVCGDEPAE